MSEADPPRSRNRLLRAMRAEDYAILAPHLSPCRLHRHMVLFDKGAALQTAWFFESGVGSLVSVSEGGQQVENGLFGRDGFAPVSILLGGERAPYKGLIQVQAEAFTLSADVLRDAVEQSASLRALMLRYVHSLYVQTAHTALSNAVHTVDERLARWLLMCHDRVSEDALYLTHEFLAFMLAVRRPSVTTALHVLEGKGLIRSDRGAVFIRDRAGLEAFARTGYGTPEREYESLLGPLR